MGYRRRIRTLQFETMKNLALFDRQELIVFYSQIVFVSELGQGDGHLPALGPVALHRVVFETSASRGRTESNIARSPRDPVENR